MVTHVDLPTQFVLLHKVSGDSICMWVPHISSFRETIWNKVVNGFTVESSHDGSEKNIFMNMPLSTFRIFGFLDDTGFRTNASGIGAR